MQLKLEKILIKCSHMTSKDNIFSIRLCYFWGKGKNSLGQWEEILKFKNMITISLWSSLKINTSKTSYSPMSINNL